MEKYVIISGKNTIRKFGYFMFWGEDFKGYTTDFSKAGRYETAPNDSDFYKSLETKDEVLKFARDFRGTGRLKKSLDREFVVKESLLIECFRVKTILDFS